MAYPKELENLILENNYKEVMLKQVGEEYVVASAKTLPKKLVDYIKENFKINFKTNKAIEFE